MRWTRMDALTACGFVIFSVGCKPRNTESRILFSKDAAFLAEANLLQLYRDKKISKEKLVDLCQEQQFVFFVGNAEDLGEVEILDRNSKTAQIKDKWRQCEFKHLRKYRKDIEAALQDLNSALARPEPACLLPEIAREIPDSSLGRVTLVALTDGPNRSTNGERVAADTAIRSWTFGFERHEGSLQWSTIVPEQSWQINQGKLVSAAPNSVFEANIGVTANLIMENAGQFSPRKKTNLTAVDQSDRTKNPYTQTIQIVKSHGAQIYPDNFYGGVDLLQAMHTPFNSWIGGILFDANPAPTQPQLVSPIWEARDLCIALSRLGSSTDPKDCEQRLLAKATECPEIEDDTRPSTSGYKQGNPDEPLQGQPDEALQGQPDEALQGQPDEALQGQPDEALQGQPDEALQGQPDEALQSSASSFESFSGFTVNQDFWESHTQGEKGLITSKSAMDPNSLLTGAAKNSSVAVPPIGYRSMSGMTMVPSRLKDTPYFMYLGSSKKPSLVVLDTCDASLDLLIRHGLALLPVSQDVNLDVVLLHSNQPLRIDAVRYDKLNGFQMSYFAERTHQFAEAETPEDNPTQRGTEEMLSRLFGEMSPDGDHGRIATTVLLYSKDRKKFSYVPLMEYPAALIEMRRLAELIRNHYTPGTTQTEFLLLRRHRQYLSLIKLGETFESALHWGGGPGTTPFFIKSLETTNLSNSWNHSTDIWPLKTLEQQEKLVHEAMTYLLAFLKANPYPTGPQWDQMVNASPFERLQNFQAAMLAEMDLKDNELIIMAKKGGKEIGSLEQVPYAFIPDSVDLEDGDLVRRYRDGEILRVLLGGPGAKGCSLRTESLDIWYKTNEGSGTIPRDHQVGGYRLPKGFTSGVVAVNLSKYEAQQLGRCSNTALIMTFNDR